MALIVIHKTIRYWEPPWPSLSPQDPIVRLQSLRVATLPQMSMTLQVLNQKLVDDSKKCSKRSSAASTVTNGDHSSPGVSHPMQWEEAMEASLALPQSQNSVTTSSPNKACFPASTTNGHHSTEPALTTDDHMASTSE